MLENKKWYGSDLNENYLFKSVPLALYICIEFQEIKTRCKEDLDAQKKIKDFEKLIDYLPKTVSKKTANLNPKPLLLILGHMFRHPQIQDESLKADLAYIRKMVPHHINCMIGVSFELINLFNK